MTTPLFNVAIGEDVHTTIAGHWPQGGSARTYHPTSSEMLHLERDLQNHAGTNAIKVVSADGTQVG